MLEFMNRLLVKDEKTKEYEWVEGLIMNQTLKVTRIYNFERMSEEERNQIIECGRIWWEESNREIPINVFLFEEMIPFEKYLINYKNQHIEEIIGHVVQLYKIIPAKIDLKNKKS